MPKACPQGGLASLENYGVECCPGRLLISSVACARSHTGAVFHLNGKGQVVAPWNAAFPSALFQRQSVSIDHNGLLVDLDVEAQSGDPPTLDCRVCKERYELREAILRLLCFLWGVGATPIRTAIRRRCSTPPMASPLTENVDLPPQFYDKADIFDTSTTRTLAVALSAVNELRSIVKMTSELAASATEDDVYAHIRTVGEKVIAADAAPEHAFDELIRVGRVS